MYEFKLLLLVHNFLYDKHRLPTMFLNYFMSNNDVHIHNTRYKYDLHRHSITTSYGDGERCVQFKGIKLWNMLPNSLKQIVCTNLFKCSLKRHFMKQILDWLIYGILLTLYITMTLCCTNYGNSVRPSAVCLSHASIVSKRLHVARCSLHCQIAKCV